MREKLTDERLVQIAEEMKKLYNYCIEKSYCISKGEFSELIGISQQSLSKVFAGKRNYACEGTLARAKKAVKEYEADKEAAAPAAPEQSSAYDSDIIRLTAIFHEELRRQREYYERIIIELGGADRLQKGHNKDTDENTPV